MCGGSTGKSMNCSRWCTESDTDVGRVPCWKRASIWPNAFQLGSSRPSSSTGGSVGMGKTLTPTSTPQHIFFFRLLFLKLILSWRMIALQCCVAVQPCEPAISPPSWPSFPALPVHPLGHHRAWRWALCYASVPCASYPFYTWIYVIYVYAAFSIFQHPPSLTVSRSLFSMSESLSWLWKNVHQYHLSRVLMYVLIYGICFSLSDLLHSV